MHWYFHLETKPLLPSTCVYIKLVLYNIDGFFHKLEIKLAWWKNDKWGGSTYADNYSLRFIIIIYIILLADNADAIWKFFSLIVCDILISEVMCLQCDEGEVALCILIDILISKFWELIHAVIQRWYTIIIMHSNSYLAEYILHHLHVYKLIMWT